MSDIVRMVAVDGWHLVVRGELDEEPTIEDEELAQKLGMSRARDIRKLIERLRAGGLLKDSELRATVARQELGGRGGHRKPVTRYRLTESGTLKVVARSDTKVANAILGQVVDVFVAYRRGLLVPRGPAASDTFGGVVQARIGDDARAVGRVRSLCRAAAGVTARTVQSIHGELRKPYGVSSIYRIPLNVLEGTVADIQRLITESEARRRLPPDRRQTELFPGT